MVTREKKKCLSYQSISFISDPSQHVVTSIANKIYSKMWRARLLNVPRDNVLRPSAAGWLIIRVEHICHMNICS